MSLFVLIRKENVSSFHVNIDLINEYLSVLAIKIMLLNETILHFVFELFFRLEKSD